MRKRPWILIILAFLHFIAPIGNIIFNALISKQNVLGYFVHAMSPEYLITNWYIILLPLTAGLAILACQRWSFYVYLIAMTMLFSMSYFGYMSKAENLSFYSILFVYMVNLSVVTYFLIPAVRNIYFDRRMRWWEIQTRYHCDFKCQWQNLKTKEKFSGKISNISINGLFLKADDLPKDKARIRILIPFNNNIDLQLFGETIIHDQSHLLGFGVEFQHNKESQQNIKKLVLDLDKKGKKMDSQIERPEDGFSYWVRTLITTGSGLIPKKEKS